MATEKKPAAKKAAPAVKKATPAAPAAKKAAPAVKKATPAPTAPVAKKAAPAPAPAAAPKFAFQQKKKEKPAKTESSAGSSPAKSGDPARDAFLAALEKKKQGHSGTQSGVVGTDKSEAHKSGPDAARRMFQRRSGAS